MKSFPNRAGTCLKAWGVAFASKLHVDMKVKTIVQRIRSKHFGRFIIWEFFGQPSGENTWLKNAPLNKSDTNYEIWDSRKYTVSYHRKKVYTHIKRTIMLQIIREQTHTLDLMNWATLIFIILSWEIARLFNILTKVMLGFFSTYWKSC